MVTSLLMVMMKVMRFVNKVSFGDEDLEMSDGNKTCSLPCSDQSEQETRSNIPLIKISSIQSALEIAAKDSYIKHKYFKKATEEEIREQRLQEKVQWECTQHNNEHLEQITYICQWNRKRELAKEHQRLHQMKKKQSEIEIRIRSPGGTKRRVC